MKMSNVNISYQFKECSWWFPITHFYETRVFRNLVSLNFCIHTKILGIVLCINFKRLFNNGRILDWKIISCKVNYETYPVDCLIIQPMIQKKKKTLNNGLKTQILVSLCLAVSLEIYKKCSMDLYDFTQKYFEVFAIKNTLPLSMKIGIQMQQKPPVLLQIIAILVATLVSEFNLDNFVTKRNLEEISYRFLLVIIISDKIHRLQYNFGKIASIVLTSKVQFTESMTIYLKCGSNTWSFFSFFFQIWSQSLNYFYTFHWVNQNF